MKHIILTPDAAQLEPVNDLPALKGAQRVEALAFRI